ncbi:MAG: DUF4282 domain-containing protein [Verrucomicrobia bacterium]|nr:DUF4282 domain-containing protein [Verrucomicrobiota bacterium]MCH8512374.1 DUF4282 domain-containing protein [Kiritimatiellia bacterium]
MEDKNISLHGDEKAKALKPRPEPTMSKKRPQSRATNTSNEVFVSKFKETNTSSENDFWTFRKMITPILIQILFWIVVIACIIIGSIHTANSWNSYRDREINILIGIALAVLGPLVARIYCEFLILFFRMNETLTEIKNKLND